MDTHETDSVDTVLAATANCADRVHPRTRLGLINAAHSAATLVQEVRIDVDTGGTESALRLAALAHEALVEEFSRNPRNDLLSLTVRVGALCRELKRHE
jgi:hypothetical protein